MLRSIHFFICSLICVTAFAAPPDDQYELGPDSMARAAGVPVGKVEQLTMSDSKIFPGTTRDWWIYVPAQYDGKTPACLMVFQDGQGMVSDTGAFRVPIVFDNLIHKKEMPVTIGVFINPGKLKSQNDPKAKPGNRSFEYDTLSDQYTRFLLEEIIPIVNTKAKLTDDPEGWAICGNSSGGICAFTAAWERPDKFRKVVSHIGSFTNIRSGHNYEALIRKTEKKPIRVFLQDGSNDLDNEHGNWPLANQTMAKSLAFKGYDYQFVYGEGTHNPKHGASIFPNTLRWIWRDYKKPQ
ncbi:MAG: alpha/beta hydrolase-fold protein [Pirellulaceae bacterium]|nr:alpha/beta hydrolase-fold protein [Pirellulaceae bacterium]